VTPAQGTHRVAFDKTAVAFSSTALELHHASVTGGVRSGWPRARGDHPAGHRVPCAAQVADPAFLPSPAADGFPAPDAGLDAARLRSRAPLPGCHLVYGGPPPTVLDDWQRDIYFENVLLENGFVCVASTPRSATGLSRTLQDTSYGKVLGLSRSRHPRGRQLACGPRAGSMRGASAVGWSGGGAMTLSS